MHIAPGTGSYGAPLFGLHFYTWSFLLFAAVILGTAILLLVPRPTATRRGRCRRGLQYGLAWAAIGLTALNAGDDLPAVRAARVSRQSSQLLGVRALRRRYTASATHLLSVLELIHL